MVSLSYLDKIKEWKKERPLATIIQEYSHGHIVFDGKEHFFENQEALEKKFPFINAPIYGNAPVHIDIEKERGEKIKKQKKFLERKKDELVEKYVDGLVTYHFVDGLKYFATVEELRDCYKEQGNSIPPSVFDITAYSLGGEDLESRVGVTDISK